MKPIVDGIGSPTHELAWYLAKILKPLVVGNTESYTKNSIDFTPRIKDIPTERIEIMVSFDISSLFTNANKTAAVELAREALIAGNTLSQRTNLNVQQIVQGIKICLSLIHFAFNNQLYHQKEGSLWDRLFLLS